MAYRKVQRVQLLGDLVLQFEGHDLRQARLAAGRQQRRQLQHVGARHHEGNAPSFSRRRKACRIRRRMRIDELARGGDGDPARGLGSISRQAHQEPVRHV